MKTATQEIRTLVVNAYAAGTATRKQLAEIFGYTIKSIGNWIRDHKKKGQLAPITQGTYFLTPQMVECGQYGGLKGRQTCRYVKN